MKVMNDTHTHWVVYIIECVDRSLYTGITNNLDARISLHNAGKAAKYTRGRGPVKLVYLEAADTKSAALRREYVIKQLSPVAKRRLALAQSARFSCT